jgi:hypothetical protein
MDAPGVRRVPWKRAVKLGLTVGLLQVAINQGEFWLRHAVDAAVVFKSVLTPLVTFTVALVAGMDAMREKEKGEDGR